MGRRKERRLAAMGGAGRRVKLDLFAEPSGDLGGSSTLEEVGGEGDSKTQAEIPSSPSSSGWLWYWEQSNGYQTTAAPATVHYCVNFQPVLTFIWRHRRRFGDRKGFCQIGQQPQNPLMLLGQYSDEELDEDSHNRHNHAEEVSVGIDEQSKVVAGKEAGDGEINHGKESSEKVEQFLMDSSAASQGPLKKVEKESITEISSGDLQRPTNTIEEATYPTAPDEHVVENVSSGWKMVLHEESNQYYYWNVATGETSWEVPDALLQETVETSSEKAIRDTEGKVEVVMGASKLSIPSDMEEDATTTTKELDVYSKINHGEKLNGSNERCKSEPIEDEEGNLGANQENRTSLLGGRSIENQSGTDLSSQLIKHCKSLLERLNSEKCLDCSPENRDLKLKYKLETEVRLADINALASHGLYLLPFWLHSEAQLKRLEAAVDSVAQRVDSASISGYQATLKSCEGAGDATGVDSSEKNGLFTAVELHAGDISVKSTFEAENNGVTTAEHVPLVLYSSSHPANNMCETSEITGTEKGNDLNPKPSHHCIDDMDMDVDMEVEETSPLKSPRGGASEAHYVSTDLSNVQNTFSDREPTLPGVFTVAPQWIPPPPPDNEPIPPPPPDDEPFPPPPPEEPPEAPYHPSHLGSVQAFPYAEQYTLSYPGSGLEYYVQTNPEVSGAALYTHSEGGQVAPSHVPHFYEASSNVYAVAPTVVNPVEPTTYYGLQNGTFSTVPLINSATESSGTQSGPAPEETGKAGSLDSHPEAESNLLLKNYIDVDKSCHGTVKAPQEVHAAQLLIGAPATSTVSDCGSVPSTSDTTSVSAAAAAASAKAQSKVLRTKKKRTVAVVSTLRSNKKVSTLVDKWKAAKEELHDEEEEPEDPYEILEKKRQREIEQWRAQQIASGEAKDNANFQPLGGDWRERVKRRRAEKMKEARRSSPDDVTDANPQTDLSELSKGLPSGWQAYWDDSSKQVYYGNVFTSETSWIRPTN